MSSNSKRLVRGGKDSAERIRVREELKRSGASGKHDSRPHRLRTRQAQKNAAIRSDQED